MTRSGWRRALPLFLALGAIALGSGRDVRAEAKADSPPAAAARPEGPVATVGWAQIDKPEYGEYLDRLRAAGCPADRVRLIVLADADEWLLQQRVAQAVANDFPWWKSEPPSGAGDAFSDRFAQFRSRRGEILKQWLGPEVSDPGPAAGKEVAIAVNLAGPVLGALPREKYDAVQEICARSMDRHMGYYNNRQNEGIFLNQGDLARLREKTRADLAQVLTPEELEEFLLRYSHNAHNLRTELQSLEPTPEEFRTIFRAVDALEHQLQLEYGALDSLSARQREDFERQREAAIRSILPSDRYQRYLVGRYPLYRQAQVAVRRAGLPDTTVLPFYEVLSAHESRRREVLNNSALSNEQRQVALQGIEREREAELRRALGEDGYKLYRDSLVN